MAWQERWELRCGNRDCTGCVQAWPARPLDETVDDEMRAHEAREHDGREQEWSLTREA